MRKTFAQRPADANVSSAHCYRKKNQLMKKLTGILLTTLTMSFPAFVSAGGTLDLSLSDTAARVAWDATKVSSGMHVSAAYLHESDDGQDGDMVSGGLHIVDVRQSQSSLYMGIGGQVYGFVSDDYSGGALGVGGFFRYGMPFNRDLALAGYVYYAPPVVSFSDIENMFDADLRLQYSVLKSAHVYAGLRMTSIKLEEQDDRYKFADGLHLGLRLDF
ncbi:MAG: hypothetical protein CMI00_06550 [Oceanospirillaceae bacterium]|nr:hypothetical protein [Oceanospirillaceae bacterium]|tara:strand:+ start:2970 stop:3620 length:651 start_codon:yes stop_codon:yes gene_type:complete